MTFSDFRAHANDLYARLGLLKFADIIHRQNVLFLYNLHHKNVPSPLNNTFSVDFTHTYNTCANNIGLINRRLVRTSTFGLRSPRYQSILSWDHCQSQLPSIRLTEQSLSGLKRHIRLLLLSLY
jgi:hypothetical protein